MPVKSLNKNDANETLPNKNSEVRFSTIFFLLQYSFASLCTISRNFFYVTLYTSGEKSMFLVARCSTDVCDGILHRIGRYEADIFFKHFFCCKLLSTHTCVCSIRGTYQRFKIIIFFNAQIIRLKRVSLQ